MIRLENVSKIYNKGRLNQVNAVDNVSIELPDKGIIALFGASGSGKTTLLNIIGGLDVPMNGRIIVDSEVIRNTSRSRDAFRRDKIGYIFQNFNLIEDITVKENIIASLKLAGIADKEERESRALEAMEELGIAKYRNRLPSTLSGGQQQRVAIARAIAKAPDIILADEPTGNLDEKNTIATMNILKALSKTKPVILVTHEPRLVSFYADYIASFADGKIIDFRKNESADTLELHSEEVIYLGDMDKSVASEGCLTAEFYSDTEMPAVNVRVVFRRGKYFIELSGNEGGRVELVGSGEISLDEGKKPVITKDNASISSGDKLFNKSIENKKRQRYFTFAERWKKAFSSYSNRKTVNKKRSKWANIALVVMAIIFTVVAAYATESIGIEEKDYFVAHPNVVMTPDIDEAVTKSIIEEMLEYCFRTPETEGNIKMMWTTSRWSEPIIYVNALSFVQTQSNIFGDVGDTAEDIDIMAKDWNYAPIELFDMEIVSQVQSENKAVVYMDEALADFIFEQNERALANAGFSSGKDFLGRKLIFGNITYTVTALVKGSGRTLWIPSEMPLTDSTDEIMVIPVGARRYIHYEYETVFDDYGWPVDRYQLFDEEGFPAGQYARYTREDLFNEFYLGSATGSKFMAFCEDPDALINGYYSLSTQFEKRTMWPMNELTLNYLTEVRLESVVSSLMLLGIILLGSLLIVYFIMRAETFGRIREIGLLRAIGVSRAEIISIFASEVCIISFFATGIGVLIGGLAFNLIQSIFIVSGLGGFVPPFWIYPVVALFLIATNVLFGILPVAKTLIKTPAQILAKYDI